MGDILRGKMIARGYSVESLAQAMGISRATFYRKKRNYGNGFTVGEVRKMAKILELTSDELNHYFFGDKMHEEDVN